MCWDCDFLLVHAYFTVSSAPDGSHEPSCAGTCKRSKYFSRLSSAGITGLVKVGATGRRKSTAPDSGEDKSGRGRNEIRSSKRLMADMREEATNLCALSRPSFNGANWREISSKLSLPRICGVTALNPFFSFGAKSLSRLPLPKLALKH